MKNETMKERCVLLVGGRRIEPLDPIELDFVLSGRAGRLSFGTAVCDIALGEAAELWLGGTAVFRGRIFVREETEGGSVFAVAFDSTAALRSMDTLNIRAGSADAVIRDVLSSAELEPGVIEETNVRIAPAVLRDRTYFAILDEVFDEVCRASGQRYVLYDDAGTVCVRDVANMVCAPAWKRLSYSVRESAENAVNCVRALQEREDCSGYDVTVRRDQSLSFGLMRTTVRAASYEDPAAACLDKLAREGKPTVRALIRYTAKSENGLPLRAGSVFADTTVCLAPLLCTAVTHQIFEDSILSDVTATAWNGGTP